jgi:hypothetical protein
VIERSVIVGETENFSVDESWLSRRPAAAEPNTGTDVFRKIPSQWRVRCRFGIAAVVRGRGFGPPRRCPRDSQLQIGSARIPRASCPLSRVRSRSLGKLRAAGSDRRAALGPEQRRSVWR